VAGYSRQQLYQLSGQKDQVEILELNIQKNHIHLVIEIAPKYSVSAVFGYLKGKLELKLVQRYKKMWKAYWGRHLWSRGYCVSMVGLKEEQIRKYVQWQEKQERELEKTQLKLF
jgi:putative transposase